MQFRDNETLRNTAKTLSENVENSRIIRITEPWQLEVIERKSMYALFYVGHGTEEGLMCEQAIIPWEKVSDTISTTQSSEHYFAACYSNAVEIEGKVGLGFNGFVDADLAALAILTYYHWPRNMTKATGYLMDLWLTGIFRMTQKSTEKNYLGVVDYRGIPFDQVTGGVFYEHPNRQQNGIYNLYYETIIHATDGSTFAARHIGVGTINAMLWGGGITAAVGILVDLAVYLAILPEGFATKIAAGIATLLAIIGIVWALFVETIIKDETGAGWSFIKDVVVNYLGWVIDFKSKWGKFWWVHQWFPLWIPFPIWGYGGILIDATPL